MHDLRKDDPEETPIWVRLVGLGLALLFGAVAAWMFATAAHWMFAETLRLSGMAILAGLFCGFFGGISLTR